MKEKVEDLRCAIYDKLVDLVRSGWKLFATMENGNQEKVSVCDAVELLVNEKEVYAVARGAKVICLYLSDEELKFIYNF